MYVIFLIYCETRVCDKTHYVTRCKVSEKNQMNNSRGKKCQFKRSFEHFAKQGVLKYICMIKFCNFVFEIMSKSDVIKALPDSVANQIAAGEVIIRPASVVKELVENSVDAGATDIHIIIKDAGRSLIQVVDNGCGMSPNDARMAFASHATSKIESADDLFNLHTMGFRGEALASIAAVAQVELKTMRHDDNIGCRLTVEGSTPEGPEACACAPGANMMVKNLFAYVPVRRKFLSKDSVELSHILHEFERLALVNTGVDFTLIHNDVTLHKLRHCTLRERIGQLFGKSAEAQIVPLETDTSIVRISGYVGLPQFAKRRGANQFFFVNGRYMQHPYFRKAVMNCYEHLIAPDMKPSYFINFEIAPERIDVNVHPQKLEIKFEDEQAIWQILTAAIKESLGRTNAAGAIDFNVDNAPDIPTFDPKAAGGSAEIDVDRDYNPFESGDMPRFSPSRDSGAPSPHRTERSSFEEVKSALDILGQSRKPVRQLGLDELPDAESTVQSSCDNRPSSGYILVNNRYIAMSARDGITVVDRHRAHVRVLYERIMTAIGEGQIATQRMIFPEAITLSAAEDLVLASICDSLATLGFDISPLGDNTWAINGMPSALSSTSAKKVITDIIDSVSHAGELPDMELFREIAVSMARNGAVNAANHVSEGEIDLLVADLFKTSAPNFTPDGLPIVAVISLDQIVRLLN